MANKITDIKTRAGGRAGIDNDINFRLVYANKFKPLRSPVLNVKKIYGSKEIDKLPEFIIQVYKFGGLEFGNWVNQLRRIDFCLNMITACYDLQKVLKFPNNNLGINGKIAVAFGARGFARAYAHYEPSTKVINLTRDRRVDKEITDLLGNKTVDYKTQRDLYDRYTKFLRAEMSGYGAFAHEYGHALDYICGEFYSNRDYALSGGSQNLYSYKSALTALQHFNNVVVKPLPDNKLQTAFYNAFYSFLFNEKGKPTGFYQRVYNHAEKTSEYWSRMNEIWARIFEIYIAYKLSKIGIVNKVLIRDGKGKYRNELENKAKNVYPTFGEMAKNYKKIDAFISTIQNKL